MEVNSIMNTAFGAKKTQTKQGNEYKKSSIGINTGFIAPSVGLLGYDVIKQKGFKNFIDAFKTNPKSIKSVDLKLNIITTVGGIVLGLLVDGLINKSRAKKADEVSKAK